MTKNMKTKLGAIACAVVLSIALAGCAQSGSTSATEAQQANRAYMSQVNETMVELDDSLDSFVAAVSRGDVVNMRTQADNAYKVLDKLAKIEAPEELKTVHDCYVEGTDKLRKALDGYITLYTEMSKSELDSSDYNARIAEVQALYDEGVAALQKGDALAAGSSQSESSSISAADSSEAASDASSASSESAESAESTVATESASSASSESASSTSA